MTKVAVYGFVRIAFDLLGPPVWWWSMKVGPANTTGIHANADFAIAGNGICAFP